ncbi:MAG: 5-formyltetrahydrofolate cyclo-ligase [Acidimicrobiia bacterium]|nr:5-formyltetrahydrofolate cyclo-ligase [Acidimicrobiia bacterium]
MGSDPDADGSDVDSFDVAEAKRRWRSRARTERASFELNHAGFCRSLERFLTDEIPPESKIVLYQAMRSEVDLTGLVAAHDHPEQRFAVTRTPDEGLVLTVHPWGGPQERHRYGYDQPRAESPRVADDEIGAVLVPALAFDEGGARLGRGKGYYDRFLARLSPSCLRIGITGDYVVERLPVGRHDVAMTHLAFSDGVRAVQPGS